MTIEKQFADSQISPSLASPMMLMVSPSNDVHEGVDDDSHRRIDEDFCRDFSCCGEKLKTMHDLLEHYETVHVVVKEAESVCEFGTVGQNSSDIVAAGALQSLSRGAKNEGKSTQTSSSEDSYDEDDGQFKPLYHGKNYSSHQQESTNQNSAYGVTVYTPQKQSYAPFAVDQQFDIPQGVHVFEEPQILTVAPALLSGPSDDEDGSQIQSLPSTTIPTPVPSINSLDPSQDYIEQAYSQYIDHLKIKHNTKRAERKALMKATGQARRQFDCLVPGCDKVYRNQNGLKYHIMHSHTAKERQLIEILSKAIKEDPNEKPFACQVSGCVKRYRNTNGLKYHLQNGHPDMGDLTDEMYRNKADLNEEYF